MTDKEKNKKAREKHIPPAEPIKPVVQGGTEDELTAGEETIAEHVATGVPTDATLAGAKQPQPGAHGHGEQDHQEDFEEDDVTGSIAAGPEAGGKETSSS